MTKVMALLCTMAALCVAMVCAWIATIGFRLDAVEYQLLGSVGVVGMLVLIFEIWRAHLDSAA